MNAVLYIPYINTELSEESFDYNGPEFNYMSKLDEVGNTIVGGNGYMNSISNNNNNKTVGFNSDVLNNQEQISFHELSCIVLDMKENNESIDNLLTYYKTKECFISTILFNPDDVDEDCFTELKSWIYESNKVLNIPLEYIGSEVKRIELLPKRTFKLKINKAMATLENCFLFNSDSNKFTIVINEINFIK